MKSGECRVQNGSADCVGAEYSISRPVATLVAIMQNASCGVRTLIACQLRFSTSTIDLFSMSVIKALAYGPLCPPVRADGHRPMRCLFFVDRRTMFGIKCIFRNA